MPAVHCERRGTAGMATLCVQAIALELGPADEIVDYRPIQGLHVIPFSQKGTDAPFQPDSQPSPVLPGILLPDLERNLEKSRVTDSRGKLEITLPPGPYIVCAIDQSLVDASEKVTRCESVTFNQGEASRLLISHTPWGDFLGFSWQ